MTSLQSISRFFANRIENSHKRAEARAERRGRRLASAPSRPPMFEQLEPRMLLSAVIPSGFVEVGSYSIGTGSATPVMTAALNPGAKYLAVASGTFKVGGSAAHIADAEYHKHPTKGWKDLTTLAGHDTDMGLDDASNRLGHWGPRQANGEYGQEFTPATSDPLAIFYRDVEGQGPNGPGSTWYDDNVGTLNLTLYQKVVVDTLTARVESTGVEVSTTESVGVTVLEFVPDNNNVAELEISATLLPPVLSSYNFSHYFITDSAGGVLVTDSNLLAGVNSVTFNAAGVANAILHAGTDYNNDGDIRDAGEESHSIALAKRQFQYTASPASLTVTRPAPGGVDVARTILVDYVDQAGNDAGFPPFFNAFAIYNGQLNPAGVGVTVVHSPPTGAPGHIPLAEVRLTIDSNAPKGIVSIQIQQSGGNTVAPVVVRLTIQ